MAFAVIPFVYYFVFVQARFRHPLEPLIAILGVYLFQSADKRLAGAVVSENGLANLAANPAQRFGAIGKGSHSDGRPGAKRVNISARRTSFHAELSFARTRASTKTTMRLP